MARIAIVGAGISGLTAAYVLHRGGHDVRVFEAGDYIGGHTCTATVEIDGRTHDVDTGFIVLNDRNYPSFSAMLEHLGVATAPSDMSFAVTGDRLDFEYSSTSVDGVYAQRRHLVSPSFQRMLLDVRRFQREAPKLLHAVDDDPSLGEYLEQHRYSRWFVDRLLVPQAAAVWSANPKEMLWRFPAKYLVRFFANHGMLGLRDRPKWSYVAGGSSAYVDRIVDALGDRVSVRTPVASIARLDDHVTIVPRGGHAEVYDHVVIAAHADQALALLADPSDDERRILGAIPYVENDIVLHTDASLLPRRRRAWASWVYHLLDEPPGKSTVTYHMNRLQRIDSTEQLCVTLNRSEAIDPAKILRRQTFAHPIFTQAGVAAQQEHGAISGQRRTHYCGAYWGWGFHEDGVVSALRACRELDAQAPWVGRAAERDRELEEAA